MESGEDQFTTSQAMGSMRITNITKTPCEALLTVKLNPPLSQWNRSNVRLTCLTL
jgi:hypothetical protein